MIVGYTLLSTDLEDYSSLVWHQSKTLWTLKLAANFQNTKPEIQIMNKYLYKVIATSDETPWAKVELTYCKVNKWFEHHRLVEDYEFESESEAIDILNKSLDKFDSDMMLRVELWDHPDYHDIFGYDSITVYEKPGEKDLTLCEN